LERTEPPEREPAEELFAFEEPEERDEPLFGPEELRPPPEPPPPEPLPP